MRSRRSWSVPQAETRNAARGRGVRLLQGAGENFPFRRAGHGSLFAAHTRSTETSRDGAEVRQECCAAQIRLTNLAHRLEEASVLPVVKPDVEEVELED